jgi:hypothetical protein
MKKDYKNDKLKADTEDVSAFSFVMLCRGRHIPEDRVQGPSVRLANFIEIF